VEGSEHTVNDSFRARVLERGEPVWQMDHVGIPIPRYLAEVERMLHLGTHSIISRKQSALSLGGKIFSVHLLNAFGVATVDIVHYLEGVRAGSTTPGSQPLLSRRYCRHSCRPSYTTSGRLSRGGTPRAPPPPPPASNWEAIVQLVRISGGRGKLAIRDKMGRIVKCADTARQLHIHVLNNIPNWRTTLGLQ